MQLVHPGRNNPPVGSGGAGELGSGELGSWGAGELGSWGASFYFNPIEVVENFCRVALVDSAVSCNLSPLLNFV